jgi:Virulence protein RhuM family
VPFDYFEELLRRIQDIRTSERRFYQKITDIYATSLVYDPTNDASLTFFKTVQNTMHWAIIGHTSRTWDSGSRISTKGAAPYQLRATPWVCPKSRLKP